jgi:Lysyl oxidase
MKRRSRGLPAIFLIVLLGFGAFAGAQPRDPGALIRVTMKSRVGVLLDELPVSLRAGTAASLVSKPPDFWIARATRQVEHTLYRLTARRRSPQGQPRPQLPLPPAEQWIITLDAGPVRAVIDDHDLVVVDYSLTSVLLSDLESPSSTEPSLATVGGGWTEPFVLPADPELLFQRTGYACIDEANNPPNNVDSENARFQYDDTCAVESPANLSCHLSEPLPTESCVVAVKNHVGHIETRVEFERLPWDQQVADQARVGQPSKGGADLSVIGERLANNRLVYRYIPADSCAIQERCVGGPGWRRLLEFDASVQNVGDRDLKIGDVGSLSIHQMFEYSPCHKHYHFRHYGDFGFGDSAVSRKQSFCLQSTTRYWNNETTALTSPYAGCTDQGISSGWGDDYNAGLDCQWIDVTGIRSTPEVRPLTFTVNLDQFLCEGNPVLDASGNLTFETVIGSDGRTEQRPLCSFRDGWTSNNRASVPVTLAPLSSAVTAPCSYGELGPRRDCGFQQQADKLTCNAGQVVHLSCSAGSPQVVRVCERSNTLNQGIPCTYQQALASVIVTDGTPVSFTCPGPRGDEEPGRSYALYTAPASEDSPVQPVVCTGG